MAAFLAVAERHALPYFLLRLELRCRITTGSSVADEGASRRHQTPALPSTTNGKKAADTENLA